MEVKYVIIAETYPITFNAALKHNQFKNTSIGKATSAGFCSAVINDNKQIEVKTYGESESLKLKPADMDKTLLRMFFVIS